MPRIDKSPGTLGAIFANLLGDDLSGDGTLRNTEKLAGKGRDDYLKSSSPCTDSTHIWTGITSDGRPLCGPRAKVLARYGIIRDLVGRVDVFRGASILPAMNGMIIYEDDIISTDLTSSVAVEFDDMSILRLHVDTTVQLQEGTNA